MKAKEWLNAMPSQFSPYDVDALSIENYKGIVFSGMGGSGICLLYTSPSPRDS